VASHTPGRLRVRVHTHSRHPQAMDALQGRLDDALGPGHARVSGTTGSVLVTYDHQARSGADMLRILRDIGVVIEETARGVGAEVPELDGGRSTTSGHIVDALADLDQQLSLLTRRKVDLKLLFPMLLGGVGLWRVMRGGLGISEVPAYVLLWYAFDSFWKFHRDLPPPPHHPGIERAAPPAPTTDGSAGG
jgi:hypothetical protein